MMTQAFYTGVSGLKSNQSAIDVVSDNIANVSTVGFRGSEYEFSSIYESMVNQTANENVVNSSVGIGSLLQATPMTEAQGSLTLSDRSTDLAINGDGWFGVQGEYDPIYTRSGNFTFDANSDLVTMDGYYVLGTMGGNIKDGVLTHQIDSLALGEVGAQEKMQFPKSLSYPPEPTTVVKFSGNVGVESETRTMGAGIVDVENNKNTLKLVFNKLETQTPPGVQWGVTATTESLDGSIIYDTQEGVANFNDAGLLISTTLTTIDNNGSEVTIDLGEDWEGVVAMDNLEITSSSTADGTIGGDLEGYEVNINGEVIAAFTNGMQSSVGKIAVYHFQNDQGLERLSGTNFQESSNSGEPIFYKDADGQNVVGTQITNFKLEASNVDMTHGMTELIILQRSFDANSKSVTTADEMMRKALEMDA